ncbi:MAG: rod shape-determining protein MreD [Bacteroidetes bacterium]|nr:rod shape-determining protein MreD [Bacteroidota bacterium]MCL5026387.1 rod shape-determining protein MreD [Chloroflexota bacterium]
MALLILPLLAIVQATVLASLPVLGHNVDLVLMVVVARSILYGRRDGILWGVVGGVSLDALSVVPFGTHALAMALVAMVVSVRGRDILHSWAFYPLLAGGLSTFLFDLLVMIIMTAFRREVDWLSVPLALTLPRALLNALVMAPIFWFAYQRVPRGRTGELRSLGL